MSLSDLNQLAQVDPEQIEVTAAQGFAALMALGMLAYSLFMIVVWGLRYFQRDYFLPAADRGILRSSPALTTVAVVLTLLMGLMGLLGSLATAGDSDAQPTQAAEESPENVPDSAAPEEDPAQSEAESAEAEDEDSDTEADVESLSLQEKFQRGIQATLIMDALILAGFGIVVWRHRARGTVRIVDSRAAARMSTPVHPLAMSADSQDMLWPDVNAASDPEGQSSRDDELDLVQAVEVTAPEAEEDGGVPVTALRWEDPSVSAADEPVSLVIEFKYAFEVFAVALIPTMALRLLIVLMYSSFSGTDVIPQHPFLELMQDGIDVGMLVTIAFMAIIMAPIMEELLYRVVILGGFAQSGRAYSGLWISSLLFGLAHGFPDCLSLLPLAFLLGYTYLRRRSYITVMLVHFIFNAYNLTLAGLGML